MKATPIYSEEELTKLWQQDKDREKKIIEKMLQENITYGEASGEYEFLNKNEKEFKAYLKIINNELDTNVEIIKHGFENCHALASLFFFHLKLFLYKRSIKISIDKILIIQNLKLKIKICCDPFQNQFAKGTSHFLDRPLSCPVMNNHFCRH